MYYLSTKQEQEQHPVGSLPEDILVETLPRVPYRSLCRFKCVSKPWPALCSDPEIRKRCPQTLSGFFFNSHGHCGFHNLSGRGPPLVDPSLPFLCMSYARFEPEQCCGVLLLCKCWEWPYHEYEYVYVVCNPMTGQWTELPPIQLQDEEDGDITCFEPMEIFLGFDAAVSSCFTVFVPLAYFYSKFTEVAIYSSKTGRWMRVEREWGRETILVGNSECVFMNGTMHLATTFDKVVTVDTNGEYWGQIDMPGRRHSSYAIVSIGQSQGRLHAWKVDYEYDDGHLYVWVLEDYDNGKWTLKHNVPVSELIGRQHGKEDMSYYAFAMHPDCNCILLTNEKDMVVLYNMDNQKVNVSCLFEESKEVIPYTPCFAEWS